MIRFRHGNIDFECSTVAEAAELLKQLLAEDERKILRQNRSPFHALVAGLAVVDETRLSPWNQPLFWKFIESLGEPQKRVLSLLMRRRRLRDGEMREALNLDNNQQLAGVLSGISKQAGAHNLPARAVYTIENESKSGEVTKTYVAALDFLQIAAQMNWPDD